MKLVILAFMLTFSMLSANAQTVRHISQSTSGDSSFYDMLRLSTGEIWLGGEYGILKRFTGQSLSSIDYPNTGVNILRIVESNNFIFLAADKGTLYRMHKPSGTWTVKQFEGYRNQCFYDMMTDTDGSLLLCGGSSGIGKGKIRIPRGFVLRLDTSLNQEPKVIWSEIRRFAWTLSKDADNQTVFSVFNGINSRLYRIGADQNLNKGEKIKGLVHSLSLSNNRLVYGGCAGLRYKHKGMWGYTDDAQSRRIIRRAGFISNVIEHENKLIAFSQQGQVWELSPEQNRLVWSGSCGSLYEGVSADGLIWLAGHGKTFLSLQ